MKAVHLSTLCLMHINPNQPVILLTSSRSNGNTFDLSRIVLPEDRAPLIDFSIHNIGCFSYSYANAGDDFLPLVEQLMPSPVWVIATPLHWYTMSAQAKTFFDRLSDLLSFRQSLGHQLRGKALAVISTGTTPSLPSAFNQPFELSCEYLGMNFLGSYYAQSGSRYFCRKIFSSVPAGKNRQKSRDRLCLRR
ncbi:multimeric flavodoxin WrbA, partial [Methylomonas methanica]